MEDNFGCREVAEHELEAVVGGGAHDGQLPVGRITTLTQLYSVYNNNNTFHILYVPVIT